MVNISVVMLTKNAQKSLHESLQALVDFPEVIVLDNGSSDRTVEIAKSFSNVKIYESDFIGFGPLKNLAISYASYPWILSIDSDEVLSTALIEEIKGLDLEDEKCIYAIERDNFYQQNHIACCGWQGDFVLRLFSKKKTKFSAVQVHESLQTTGMQVVKLKGHMKHYAYESIEQLIDKLQFYSSLYAKENSGKKHASPSKAFFRAAFTFFKNYVLQKGFLYGYEGLLISVCNANGTFYKYMKLYEANRYV